MKDRQAPRLALALLDRFVPDSEPLAGDLVEQFDGHPSALWFWVQVLAAIATAWGTQSVEIRPLQLVDLQPADAAERTRRLSLRFPAVSPSASPLTGVGGLGLGILAGVVTWVAPGAWWLFVASALVGCALGVATIALREHAGGRPRTSQV